MIWDMTMKAREWVVNFSDLINPGSDPRRVDGTCAASIPDLQRLLSEANSLPVTVVEADELARTIQSALVWQRKAEEVLGSLQVPARALAGRGTNPIQLSILKDALEEAQLIPVRLEQRIKLQDRVQGVSVLATNISGAFLPGRRFEPRLSLLVVDLSHVKRLLNASSTIVEVEIDMKEFTHTNNLIANAEVLESGEPARLQGPKALLTEAEGIPVTMDEQQLMTIVIKARQWRLRVDGMLAGGKANLYELQDFATKVDNVRKALSELHQWRADHANVLEPQGLLNATTSESRSAVMKKVPGYKSISKNGGAATGGDNNTASPMNTSDD